MNKVIKVTDEEVFIGKEDGSIIKTERSNASWNIKIGDEVELFIDGDMIIPSLKKKSKIKTKNKSLAIITKLAQRLFAPIFTIIWALAFISIIILGIIPRGDTYLYKDKIMGVDVSSKMVFSSDGMEIEAKDENGEYKITSYSYKVVSGSLYVWNDEEQDYEYWGKISSTKLKLVSGMVEIELRETRLFTVKIVSIVLLSVFASFDLVVMILVVIGKCLEKKNSKGNLVGEGIPEKSILETSKIDEVAENK